MSVISGVDVVRESARRFNQILLEHDGDPSLAPAEVDEVLRPVLGLFDLFDSGFPRATNHTDATRLIYFDPGLSYILAKASAGIANAAHNHGAWNITAVAQGQMHYRSYRRLDDRSKPGYAKLELVEDAVLSAGDIRIAPPPPHDIHEVAILTDDQWTLTVAPGLMSTSREYYDPASDSYADKAAFA